MIIMMIDSFDDSFDSKFLEDVVYPVLDKRHGRRALLDRQRQLLDAPPTSVINGPHQSTMQHDARRRPQVFFASLCWREVS